MYILKITFVHGSKSKKVRRAKLYEAKIFNEWSDDVWSEEDKEFKTMYFRYPDHQYSDAREELRLIKQGINKKEKHGLR